MKTGAAMSEQSVDRAKEGVEGEAPVSPPWNPTVKVTVIVFGVVIFGGTLLRFREVIGPLIVASLIAYVLTPMVYSITTRTCIPRGIATAAIYLLFFGLIALAVSLLAPLLVRQALSFQLDFLQISDYVETFLSRPLQIGNLSLDLAPLYDGLISTLTGLVQPLATQTMTILAGVVTTVIEVIFIGIVSFYLTKDGPQMGRALMRWVPPRLRYDFKQLQDNLSALWRAFFRGQLLLALTMGTTISVLMAIVGMRNALILGLLAFFFEFLFSVGHGLWLLIAVPLALFQGSSWIPLPNFWIGVLVLGLHLVLQQVDLNFFVPHIVGRQVHLHPMVVIIGIIAGGMLGGVLGILLAAPTIASALVLISYAYRKLLDLPPWPDLDEKRDRTAKPEAQDENTGDERSNDG
jgi:predicted PurR-regulated permease PerM